MKLYILGILLILCNALFAQAPVVENVRFEQRTDGTLLVDIYYDVTAADSDSLEIVIEASDNRGDTYILPCTSLTGDVGEGITPGKNKHVIWDFYADNPDTSGNDFCIRVTAYNYLCGLVITEDYVLTEDMFCSRPDNVGYACAIKIGAPNITLDLGGHTIHGDLSNGYIEGILVENCDGIIIKNGTVENFGIAIAMANSSNSTIEDMRIINLVCDDPNNFCNGIVVGESHDVVIRDSYFEFLPVMHKEEIIMAGSKFTVDNCEFRNGSVGVNFAGESPSNGSVINCRFYGVGAGLLFQRSTNGQIQNNIFRCETGIMTDPSYYGEVKGLTIEENDIQDGYIGILFYGTIESSIANNNRRKSSIKAKIYIRFYFILHSEKILKMNIVFGDKQNMTGFLMTN